MISHVNGTINTRNYGYTTIDNFIHIISREGPIFNSSQKQNQRKASAYIENQYNYTDSYAIKGDISCTYLGYIKTSGNGKGKGFLKSIRFTYYGDSTFTSPNIYLDLMTNGSHKQAYISSPEQALNNIYVGYSNSSISKFTTDTPNPKSSPHWRVFKQHKLSDFSNGWSNYETSDSIEDSTQADSAVFILYDYDGSLKKH